MDTIINYFISGGPIMWPILVFSILSWAIIIERSLRLRRAKLVDDLLVHEVRSKLAAGQLDEAQSLAKVKPVLIGAVIDKGIEEYRHTEADFETAMQGAAERQMHVLWNNMGALNTLARVATMMGLLGTVVGMVRGFEELTKAGVAKEKLAAAIGVALVTTVGGLCVAIPAIIGESALKGKIRKLMIHFEEVLIEVVKAARIGKVQKSAANETPPAPRPEKAVAAAEAQLQSARQLVPATAAEGV